MRRDDGLPVPGCLSIAMFLRITRPRQQCRLALVSNRTQGAPMKGTILRAVFPSTKDPRNGTLHQRHQNHERPVRASVTGYLLCRKATGEAAAENGRQAAQAGFPCPS